MPLNIPGILVPFHLLVNPRLVVPSLIIKDIRQLNFAELYRAGYRGAVFDKDNCLTIPHEDKLVPELTDAWRECRETFGKDNVLIVSNTAGSHLDAGLIEAESVSHHLSAPVLRHASLKPSYACAAAVRAYFSALPRPVRTDELLVVGDRVLTDVVLANRLRGSAGKDEKAGLGEKVGPGPGVLAVWTTGLWRREALGVRWLEKGILAGVERWVVKPEEVAAREELLRFVRRAPVVEEAAKEKDGEGIMRRLWTRMRRSER